MISIKITSALSDSLNVIKSRLHIPQNSDGVLRQFAIKTESKSFDCFAVFFDGMVRTDMIDEYVLQPLIQCGRFIHNSNDLERMARDSLISHCVVSAEYDFDKAVQETLYGSCAVFIDGYAGCLLCEVKGWSARSVGEPVAEAVIRGPQAAFVESIRPNTGMVRKIIRDENLIIEGLNIGKKSMTSCAFMYISDIAADQIVDDVRNRLKNIDIDYIFSSGELEQLIENYTFLASPQVISTERPDRVAAGLAEGRVAILLDGSPYALVLPINVFELMHTPDDKYMRFYYANLSRIVRYIGGAITLLFPALFIAAVNFQREVIPSHLLYAIESSRERAPFSLVFELIILEIAFELVREAGIRVPNASGPTLSIIGALIIGQAAVEANLVSPIVIIVVALTGISSFAIPSYALSFSFRVVKYIYILFAAMAGLLGIAVVAFVHLLIVSRSNSFGVPLLSPLSPTTKFGIRDAIFERPIWKRERRSVFLHPKKLYMQPKYSRKWSTGDELNASKHQNNRK